MSSYLLDSFINNCWVEKCWCILLQRDTCFNVVPDLLPSSRHIFIYYFSEMKNNRASSPTQILDNEKCPSCDIYCCDTNQRCSLPQPRNQLLLSFMQLHCFFWMVHMLSSGQPSLWHDADNLINRSNRNNISASFAATCSKCQPDNSRLWTVGGVRVSSRIQHYFTEEGNITFFW
jgi:hypothetical protein